MPRSLAALTILLFALVSVAHSAPTMTRHTTEGGKISLLLPSSFKQLDAATLKRKYPNASPPNLAYSNEAVTVNVAIAHTPHAFTTEQLAQGSIEDLKAGLASSSPNATWLGAEMTKIDGRLWFLLDLRTPSADVPVRNLMAGTSIDGRLLVVSFNCIEALEAEWIPVGTQIIRSLRVN